MSLSQRKSEFRKTAMSRRAAAAGKAPADAAARLAGHLDGQFGTGPGRVISGYLAIGDELDVAPALEALAARGHEIALPVVVAMGAALEFRGWTRETALEDGPLGTRHPAAESPVLVPDLLLIPLLAFDGEGYRIGWGGGFYDRTLAALRAEKTVTAVGVGLAAQRVDKVPRDHHDARLDWIATEAGLHEVATKS